ISAKEDVWLPQLLVDADLVKSTSDGRRMIKQNAVSLDGAKIQDMNTAITPAGEILLKVGKRRFAKVIFS
ncbi:MAG: tyrosine--tRNA ligase, partial [Bacteroidetes bacterium]|nr:tyrosine--tRNA ligase [Bacteroidota bacterium]